MRILAAFVLILILATGPGGHGAAAQGEQDSGAAGQLEEFEPSEVISSDLAVSFPVDI